MDSTHNFSLLEKKARLTKRLGLMLTVPVELHFPDALRSLSCPLRTATDRIRLPLVPNAFRLRYCRGFPKQPPIISISPGRVSTRVRQQEKRVGASCSQLHNLHAQSGRECHRENMPAGGCRIINHRIRQMKLSHLLKTAETDWWRCSHCFTCQPVCLGPSNAWRQRSPQGLFYTPDLRTHGTARCTITHSARPVERPATNRICLHRAQRKSHKTLLQVPVHRGSDSMCNRTNQQVTAQTEIFVVLCVQCSP
jgi:hypothetical protein